MTKKIFFVIFTIILLFSFSSCAKPDNRLEGGWQNNNETTEHTEAQTVVIRDDIPEQKRYHVDFSVDKAIDLGMFKLKGKGNISVFFQEDYILLFDDYGNSLAEIKYDNYTIKPKEDNMIFTDMNFDGYTDIGLLTDSKNGNDFYSCFIFRKNTEEFLYNETLSSLSSPSFDKEKQTVTENKTDGTKTIYHWDNNKLI